MSPITSAQIRGARATLGWSMEDLVEASGVSTSIIKQMEMTGSQQVGDDLRDLVRVALEQAGIAFLDEDGLGEGVRLRKVRSGDGS